MKPSFVFVLLVLAFVSSQAHAVSKGNSSLRGKIGKEGSDLLKNRVLKKAKGSKHGKENKTSSSTSGGGDSNRVPGIEGTNIGTINGDTTTYNRAGTSVVGTCNPNGNNKTPLPSVKGLDLRNIPLESGCDTSSDCSTCCCFANVFYDSGLVPQKGYCVDNTQLNEIMTQYCIADATETSGEQTDITGNGNLGGDV